MGDISGKWSDKLCYQPANAPVDKKRVLFDVKTMEAAAPKFVVPESEQETNESRRQWAGLTKAIGDKNMDAATESKTAVEESQREVRRKREESGQKYVPRYFELRDGRWMPKLRYVISSRKHVRPQLTTTLNIGPFRTIRSRRLQLYMTGCGLSDRPRRLHESSVSAGSSVLPQRHVPVPLVSVVLVPQSSLTPHVLIWFGFVHDDTSVDAPI